MTYFEKKVPANFVPAAAVIREGQALFGMIGRKEHVDCLYNIFCYFLKNGKIPDSKNRGQISRLNLEESR